MTTQDRIRLLKIDEQIMRFEDQLDEVLAQEFSDNRQRFRASSTYRYMLENAMRRRKNLLRAIKEKITREETYEMILEERREEVKKANEYLQALLLKQKEIELMLVVDIANKQFHQTRFREASKAIKAQHMVVYNKERALNFWLNKDIKKVVIREMVYDMTFKSVKDNEKYGMSGNGVDNILEVVGKNRTSEADEAQARYQEYMSNLEKQKTNNNNATIDMLTQPTQELVEENPFALNEPKKKIVI